jgi:D-alanyl-D-alanine carboxypeptidase
VGASLVGWIVAILTALVTGTGTATTVADTSEAPLDHGVHSTTDPSSIWVIVNKTHPIEPPDFRPDIRLVRGYQVAAPAAEPLEALLDAGDRRGLGLKIESAFRSYDYQLHVHAATAAGRGDACFAHTAAGRWLARNAWRWGFIVRYQPETTAVTGYAPEPWHLRYVGRPLAGELRRTGTRTLEEFFGVPGGDYAG